MNKSEPSRSTPPDESLLQQLEEIISSLAAEPMNYHTQVRDTWAREFGNLCWDYQEEIIAALRTQSEIASSDPFSRLASLIADINIDRYGKPLVAALHLCNDLADEVASKQSATGEITGADTPLCDGHAAAWFTERNHLEGDTSCVVCAFQPCPPHDVKR